MIRLILVTLTCFLTTTASYAQWNFLGGSYIGWGALLPEAPILEIDSSGNPIILDESDGFYGASLKKFVGNSWLKIPMDSLNIFSYYTGSIDLSINNSNDMILGYYNQITLPSPKAYRSFFVKKFNGTSWASVGSNYGQIDSINDSTLFLWGISVKLSQTGTPFAAFTYRNKPNDTTRYVVVKKFNGSTWVKVGLSATVQEYGYYNPYNLLELFLGSNDTPYVHTEGGNILKLNGQNWDLISNAQKVFMDSQKILYSADADTGFNPSITLKKYTGGNWITVSNSPSGTSNKIRLLALAISPTGTPHIAYENLQSNYVSIINYNGNSWQPSGTNLVEKGYNAKFAFTSSAKLIIRINDYYWADSIYRWVLTYNPGVGLSPLYSNTTLTNYPNPTSDGILHLQLPEYLKEDDKVFVTIRDLAGKIILQKERSPGLSSETNVDQLASGIYIVSVSINNIPLKSFKFCKN